MMRFIITGDKSRYQYFRDMVNLKVHDTNSAFFTEKLGENDIYLTSDKRELKDGVFYSEKVPLNTTLFFPKEYGDLSITYEQDDRVLFFDEFPFGTDEEISNLKQINQEKKLVHFEVVLFQNDRDTLESDISTEEMALEEARLRYEKYNINVQTYRVNEKSDFLLWSLNAKGINRRNLFIPIIKEARNYLETFDSCYDLNYEFDLHFLIENPESLDMHFEFDRKLNRNNVWELYYQKAYDYYWKNNYIIDEFIVDTYKRGIINLCVWDLEVAVNKLRQEVRELFSQQFKCFKLLRFDGAEETYAQFINENLNEILVFKTKIVGFFTDELKQFLKNRIARDIERMESLLNE